jgi:hypothetical protein
MKGERKLSLVKPPAPAPPGEDLAKEPRLDLPPDEAEPTQEELREAEALRMALDRGEDPMAAALRAAFRPAPIGDSDLDAILARAMGDLDAPPTAIEEREADRLRAALEGHDAQRAGRLIAGPGARASLPEDSTGAAAVALRAAWAPSPIGAAKNDALVGRALEAASASSAANENAPAAKKRGGSSDGPAPLSLRRFRLGPRTLATMTAVVAMAAGALLFVGKLGSDRAEAPVAAVVTTAAPVAAHDRAPRIAARSTTDLFDAATPFPRTGGESARVDRIAGARAADLRANRFAAWGVR